MKRLAAFCLMLAVCRVATADDIPDNGIPGFTYNQATGIVTVDMDGDEDLMAWAIPYAGYPFTVDFDLDFPPGPHPANGGWSAITMDGFIQMANTTQDVRIGRVRHLAWDPVKQEVIETFTFENEQVFQVAQLPTGLTYADFPGLGEGVAELMYGGEGPIGNFDGTTDYTTLEIVSGVVPEPSMIVLLVCGGLGILATAIRRRRS